MTIQYTSRKDKVYYLRRRLTKKGNPVYYFSDKLGDNTCDAMPDGYEIYEHPNGQVHCRRVRPRLIADIELAVVQRSLEENEKTSFTLIDVQDKDIVIYEGRRFGPKDFADFGIPFRVIPSTGPYQPVLKFQLIDEENRHFHALRWCFRGSIDDWIPLRARGELADLADRFCPHVGEESLLEYF